MLNAAPIKSRSFALGTAFVSALTPMGFLVLPDPYPWVVSLGLVGMVYSFAARLDIVVFVWGALLPIWSVGTLPPLVFDTARFGLGVVIALRAAVLHRDVRHPSIALWAKPLLVAGFLLVITAWWRGEAPTHGLVMLASLACVTIALRSLPAGWPLLAGFVTGTTISAIVLILGAFDVSAVALLSHNTNPGFARLTGLGTSAARVSLEFAIAALLCWALLDGKVRGRLLPAISGAICLVALLLCGSRTGAAAMGCALLVMLIKRWVRPLFVTGFAFVMAGVLIWIARNGSAELNTFERLTAAGVNQGDFSSGRVALVGESVRAFVASPWLGMGIGPFTLQYGAFPHLPPLFFAVGAGVVAGLIVLTLSLRMVHMMFSSQPGTPTPLEKAGRLVNAALVASILLEPTGPFVGMELLTLLLFSALLVSEIPQLDDHGMSTTDEEWAGAVDAA